MTSTPSAKAELKKAVESLHGCIAIHRDDIDVVERFKGRPIWAGAVSVFEITGHPEARECYAWSEPVKGSGKCRFFAVLKLPPVDSPESAVRASIMADAKAARGE